MKAHTASLINAVLLIVLPLWGYLSSETPSKTALIPAGIGIILLVMNPGVKKENKVIAHIAVLLTLLILIALIKPLMGAVGRGDSLAILRLAVMIISTALAMVFFVKSFIDARKRREKEAAEAIDSAENN
jgi:Ca2+/Na+ antiporter